MLLNNAAQLGRVFSMKHRLLILAVALAVACSASAVSAACVVEYKAKRTSPTEYRHATMSVPDELCSLADARPYVEEKLSASGWTLLSIVKVGG